MSAIGSLGKVVRWLGPAACVACAGTTGAGASAPPKAEPRAALTIQPTPSTSTSVEPLRVELQGKVVNIAGEAAPGDAMGLRGALARHRHGASTIEARLLEPDDAALDNLLQAATGTELRQLVLLNSGARFEISLLPSRKPTHELALEADGRLHLRPFHQPTTTAELAWPLGSDGDYSQLPSKFAELCGLGCVIQVSRFAPGSLLKVLGELQRAHAGQPAPEVYVNLRQAEVARASGRLAPELIQRVVRQRFELFRTCYEAGLGRDGKLTGRVIARFVITREGTVAKVSDGGSDIPDAQVRDCVLEKFGQLEFPKPEGGIVTVVYPILLAPE